jgi:hypothetical protein
LSWGSHCSQSQLENKEEQIVSRLLPSQLMPDEMQQLGTTALLQYLKGFDLIVLSPCKRHNGLFGSARSLALATCSASRPAVCEFFHDKNYLNTLCDITKR